MSLRDRFSLGAFLLAALMSCAPAILIENPLDTSFGTEGKVTTDMGSASDIARRVAIQKDGKILVAGTGSGGNDKDFFVARYNGNGTLDTSFSGDGKLFIDFGKDDEAFDIAIDGSNRILVGGVSGVEDVADFALARCTSDGTLDPSFSGDGMVIGEVSGANLEDAARGLAIQSVGGNEMIVLAGYAESGSGWNFALARFDGTGAPDTTFGTGGQVRTDVGNLLFGGSAHVARAFDVAIQADGKIVAAGYAANAGIPNLAVARYSPDGGLDPAFDTDGVASAGTDEQQAHRVLVQSDQKILLGGYMRKALGPDYSFKLARFLGDGSPDGGFGTAGEAATSFGTSAAGAHDLAIDDSGRIIAAGYSTDKDGVKNVTLARYGSSGALDTSFGDGGLVTVAMGTSHSEAYGVALQTDGKIVMAGRVVAGSSYDIALARLNP